MGRRRPRQSRQRASSDHSSLCAFPKGVVLDSRPAPVPEGSVEPSRRRPARSVSASPGAGRLYDRPLADVWTRHYAGDYGKPQRDEARARMLEHGFGTVEPEVKDVAARKPDVWAQDRDDTQHRPGESISPTRDPTRCVDWRRVLDHRGNVLGVDGVLREVVDSDLDAFFEHQREPEANRMAAFRPATAKPSTRLAAAPCRRLADQEDDRLRGRGRGQRRVLEQKGRRLVGYWIGREFWGKGLATRALQELTGEVTQRPLHAWVATSNVASIRVLEKCGFVASASKERRRRAALRATPGPLAVATRHGDAPGPMPPRCHRTPR